MPRKKKIRIETVMDFPNVFEDEKKFLNLLDSLFQGNDRGAENHIIVELGCGKGEYTLALAEKFPSKFFIGVDIKADRIWFAANGAKEKNLTNIAFIRTNIENIEKFFKDIKVSEIWITFPDPQPQSKREKHRLTNPKFLEIYKKFLKKDGVIHLKTDHIGLFDYSLGVLKSLKIKPTKIIKDIHCDSNKTDDEILLIETKYEKIHRTLGDTINYMAFKF